MMIMMKKLSVPFITVFLLSLFMVSPVISAPMVSISQKLDLLPGGKVIANVNLSNMSGTENLIGYYMRFDYDDTMLSNPVAVTQNTLSEDYSTFISVPDPPNVTFPPVDGIGKFSIWIQLKFPQNQNGILLKIRFDLLPGFVNGSAKLRFVVPNTSKTLLYDNQFKQIDAKFIPFSGDIDGNEIINLVDAIVALQVLTNIKPVSIGPGSDINGNNKTGLQEVIYVLQFISKIRND